MPDNPRPTRRVLVVGFAALLAVSVSCTSGPPEPEFRPAATIQDIMLSIVDPSADAIWESVATIITHEGVEERRPRTDEEWERLRHEAVRLMEASNLLLIENRDVAVQGFRSENPGIELQPEDIQVLITEDRTSWDRLVRDFYDVSLTMLNAVDAKDADMLFDYGGPLDRTCEGCHQRYWYPDDAGARERAAARLVRSSPPDVGAPRSLGPTGAIQGHVSLAGELPGNAVIRMGVDPLCGQLTADKLVVQENVLTSPDGSLANVFVQLEGTFPAVPVPDEPVVIDQVDCVFVPRVVGVQVGQTVQIKNSDPLLHNLHSYSTTTNSFNVGQPMEGMVYEVQLEAEDGMLRIGCDLHRWMTEYIGVVEHPYFSVSDLGGTFTIDGVPPGTHTIQAWHEEYGIVTQTLTVEAGETTGVDFTYGGDSR